MKRLDIYTDGSCSVNSGKGGWGIVVVYQDKVYYEACGAEENTTNNKMELTAFLTAMKWVEEHFKDEHVSYTIHTDSAYIANCFKDQWYKRWEINGWRTANRVAVKNKELWEEIIKIYKATEHICSISYVKGHSDNVWNERADTLATSWRGNQC